ncbi:MAG: UDP-N-acetylglucosamine 4,6-dehydratase (inverting) [Alphaproteobacteria bacterium]
MNDILRKFDTSDVDLNGKSILITGGTGSFGRHLMKVLLERWTPSRVIIFSRDESKQSDMALDYPVAQHQNLRYFIGDVRDYDRLEMAMRNVDIVVHAAALKQVPAAEYNPFECIRTNVNGAENVVRAAIVNNVEHVIALSTDKAANPVNLYGASKLASDKIFVAGNNLSGRDGTRFSVVRYGNVIGSRGSVVPLFRRLIASGVTSLPITDDRMTRFWITLDQGVDFVLSSLAIMQGGEVFVPRIPSMRIVDLATAMAPDLEVEIVGIRPGEKLHEVMVTEDDARSTVMLEDRYVIEPAIQFWDEVRNKDEARAAVPADFRYASDTNDEWIDVDAFRDLLKII